jgi:hypothetical protein
MQSMPKNIVLDLPKRKSIHDALGEYGVAVAAVAAVAVAGGKKEGDTDDGGRGIGSSGKKRQKKTKKTKTEKQRRKQCGVPEVGAKCLAVKSNQTIMVVTLVRILHGSFISDHPQKKEKKKPATLLRKKRSRKEPQQQPQQPQQQPQQPQQPRQEEKEPQQQKQDDDDDDDEDDDDDDEEEEEQETAEELSVADYYNQQADCEVYTATRAQQVVQVEVTFGSTATTIKVNESNRNDVYTRSVV